MLPKIKVYFTCASSLPRNRLVLCPKNQISIDITNCLISKRFTFA